MYLKPSRRKKMRKRTTIIIIAAVAAAVALACVFLFTDVSSLFSDIALKELEKPISEDVTASSNGILFRDGAKLVLLDKNGKNIWDLKLESEDSSFASSETLICSYSQKTLTALSYTKEQLFTTAMDSDILKVSCGKEYIAVLTSIVNAENGKTQYAVYLFNTKGEKIGPLEFSMRQVIDFGFNGDNDMFWALSLDNSGIVPVSYVATFNTDGTMTGSIEVNTQIVEKVYVTDSSIFALGTNNMTSYSYFGEKQADVLIYGWRPFNASVTDQQLKIACVSRTDVASIDSARIFSTDLTDTMVHLPRNIFYVAITQKKLYAFSPTNIYTYSDTGELEKTQKVQIDKVKQVSDDCAIVWDKSKSYIMHLS
ncbi:MAG: hypothetical protein RR292_04305 [Christensenellaceae bacterium]